MRKRRIIEGFRIITEQRTTTKRDTALISGLRRVNAYIYGFVHQDDL